MVKIDQNVQQLVRCFYMPVLYIIYIIYIERERQTDRQTDRQTETETETEFHPLKAVVQITASVYIMILIL